MAKIDQQPVWPWGAPGVVREKLVEVKQLQRRNLRGKGDPKKPALASAALLDSIGPAHSSEDIRLPMPPPPPGNDAAVTGYMDRGPLVSVAERLAEAHERAINRALETVRAPPERVERLKSLLGREAEMLDLVASLSSAMVEIERRRRQETPEEM